MSISATYFLNVALHAAILSILATAILLTLRQARYRAIAAIAGLLAVGYLPWISALRSSPAEAAAVAEIASGRLPVWTVVTLPAQTPAIGTPVSQSSDPIAFWAPTKSAIALWAAGSVAGLFLLGIAWVRQRHWTSSLEGIDDASWAKLQTVTSSLPDRSAFFLTSSVASPCITGFRHPRVVLPRFLFAEDSDTALGWAVRHELSHLRAGDSRWMLIFSLIRCLHWWNPFAYHLISRWAEAREQLCDLAAAEIPASRTSYGQFLVAMAGRIPRRPPLTVAMARRAPARQLKSRIVSLLDAEPGAEKSVGKRFIGFGCCLALCCATAVSCMKVGSGISGAQTGATLSDLKTSSLATPDSLAVGPRANTAGPRQIKITAKLMVTSSEPNFASVWESDDSVKRVMRESAKVGKINVATLPSITAKSGQTAIAEDIHQVRKSGPTGAVKSPVPFVGINLSFVPRFSGGLAIDLQQTVDYRYVPGVWHFDGTGKNPPAGLSPANIKFIRESVDTQIFSGATLCTKLGEIEPGKYLTLLTKAEAIDATGRPLRSQ